MTRLSLAVVLPAFDELENLKVLLPELHEVLAGLTDIDSSVHVVLRAVPDPYEIESVSELGAIPVTRRPTDSFGDAIRTGIASVESHVDFVIFMDADGSHDPTTIPRLLANAEGNDVVIASRYTSGGTSDNGPLLRAMSRSLNLGFRVVLGIPAKDISTNFKLYRREQLQVVELTCDKFDIVEEILFRLQRFVGKREFRVAEIPDYFRERRFGESKRQLGPFVASYIGTLVRLRISSSTSPTGAPPPSK